MTVDEARALFSEAMSGELDEAKRVAFEAACAADAGLASEYAEFRSMLGSFQQMRRPVMAGTPTEEVPDVLGGVQEKLRARSGGRFYGTRFEMSGGGPALVIAVGVGLVLVVVAVAVMLLR